MSFRIRTVVASALALGMTASLAACGRGAATNDAVAAAPGARPTAVPSAAATPALVRADPAKTGQAFIEELEHDPALFEKQKQICGNHGSDMQPNAALEQPCAEWDKAREDLELNRADQEGGVKNTDRL